MDKQDELAALIWESAPNGTNVTGEDAMAIAAAVRSYLGSDEVVERVAMAVAIDLDGFENDPTVIARAALSAAGGGHAER